MPDKKVVLFFPSYASQEASPPLALISIAGPLVQEGYRIEIIDSAVEPDYIGKVLAHLKGAICLGISLITGPMIRDTIEVGKAVKERYPNLPIILGGWHPSILPEQTLKAPFVDAVVLRQGEVIFKELVNRLGNGESLDGLSGVLYKQNGEIVHGPPRPYTGVAHLPDRMPGYDLIDYDRYEKITRLRWVMYSTSHGCPFNCSYCSNASVYGRNLDVLPAEQVIDQVTYLVRKFGINLLGIIDDIYFAFMDRSLQIAEGFIRSGLKFQWYIQDRADSWSRLTPDQARIYARSGLSRVHFGAESGSDRVLHGIEKKSDVARTLEAVDRCKEAGIRASFGFIFGLPDEQEEDLRMTVDLIREIHNRYDRTDCYANIFTPYPGSPLWPRSIELGLDPPKALEDWIDFYPRLTVLPWLNGAGHRRLQAVRQYLRFGYPNIRVGEQIPSLCHRMTVSLFGPSARWRIRRHRYEIPLEIRGYQALQRLKSGFGVYDRF